MSYRAIMKHAWFALVLPFALAGCPSAPAPEVAPLVLPTPDAAAPPLVTAPVPASAAPSATPSASAPIATAQGASCTSDAECVITTFECCPDCCGRAPRPIHVKDLDMAKRVCAVATCAAPGNCAAVRCKSDAVGPLRAVCVNAQCAAVAATSPRAGRGIPAVDATCTTDADCVLTSAELTDAPPRTYACCPGCVNRAGSKAWKARFDAACAATPPPMCPPIGCAMPIQRAVCAGGQCVVR